MPRTADRSDLEELLEAALAAHREVSDVVLIPGRMPLINVYGQLYETPLGAWSDILIPEDTAELAEVILADDERLQACFEATGSADCAVEIPEGPRFRANVFRARDTVSIVLRVLPSQVPTLESLALPAVIEEIPQLQDGLVLVAGATGAGKSTTLASILDRVNRTRAVHVVTLEDPIEFVHPHATATMSQREMGRDFSEFSVGLRAALRQAPKVILLGEMRDRTTTEIALKAAETGHLVLSTVHSVRAGDVVNRISGMFEAAERDLVRTRLAQVLRFLVAQRLLPRADAGRVAAIEVLGVNLRARKLIEEGESEDNTFTRLIEDNRPRGWQTFDHHIVEHFTQGLITPEVAVAYATDRASVSRVIDGIKTRRGQNTSDLGELEMANVKPPRS